MATHKDVSTVLSRAPLGLSAPQVRVEVHLGAGLPAFAMVGLPEAVVRESKERVRSALVTSGFDFPAGRITVNLSPADLPKEGGRFDLPIAVGILAAIGSISPRALEHREFYGELSLGGDLRQTPKLLPALIEGARCGRELILPFANALEAALVRHPKLKLASHLREVCAALRGQAVLPSAIADPEDPADPGAFAQKPPPDLAEVRGQFAAKRALEIAAAGEHGLLMIGPPGAGKTLLAQRLPGLLPPLGAGESLEVASLESAAGRRPSLGGHRPFRNPQHTASVAALIGGAAMRPGELSLAHLGVLFLDELPEFARNALEALREPLESGVVNLTRLKRTCEFPAKFQLVAAMNPCPCGYAGDPRGRCNCTLEQVARYRQRISGPLIDRIDIHVELAALPVEHLLGDVPAGTENSATVALRVAAARQAQIQRQGKFNARLTPQELTRFCGLQRESRLLLGTAISRLGLSARACHRVQKLARTCADLAGESRIRTIDVAEAVGLRALDKLTC
ncbi:MAG TPA: YifB family Mg chelatase-like AAA ATPase [Steroidobacteraceae bacterium]|nr:YifB family Mg chelatase-like AAA ATPase [Steroidobacteraceae bacterium]